jgi:hypothetical protein
MAVKVIKLLFSQQKNVVLNYQSQSRVDILKERLFKLVNP